MYIRLGYSRRIKKNLYNYQIGFCFEAKLFSVLAIDFPLFAFCLSFSFNFFHLHLHSMKWFNTYISLSSSVKFTWMFQTNCVFHLTQNSNLIYIWLCVCCLDGFGFFLLFILFSVVAPFVYGECLVLQVGTLFDGFKCNWVVVFHSVQSSVCRRCPSTTSA